MGRWQQKAKEFFSNHGGAPTPKATFHLLTITLLSLLLPLSFFLLASLSAAKHYLQTFTLFLHSPQQQQQPFSFLFTLALQINPCILYVLVSIVSIATLINGLMGKITLLNDSSTSPVLQPSLYIAWILLCAFQFCVGLGIEASIAAGIFEFDNSSSSSSSSFGESAAERSLLSKVFFLLGLHETTQVWYRVVVRPVVDDTVFGGAKKEKWIERVAVAASLGVLWWWRLREEVESLVVMAEAKKSEQFGELELKDFIGWWLYYVTVTIGMVRIVKGLMWMFMVALCRRRVTEVPVSPVVESSLNDDKV
uniref:Transmembrane protein n=1 Tax=Lotus japonicus TaxID=34305 RepID=I3T1Q9_LOTJA|nr:unknown [Lotus japonicus]